MCIRDRPSSAYIASVAGQVVKIAPPANVTSSGICSPDKVFVFDEQQGVTLASPLKVGFTSPGFYAAATGQNLSIPAGTVVDSHFLDGNLGGCLGTPVRD